MRLATRPITPAFTPYRGSWSASQSASMIAVPVRRPATAPAALIRRQNSASSTTGTSWASPSYDSTESWTSALG